MTMFELIQADIAELKRVLDKGGTVEDAHFETCWAESIYEKLKGATPAQVEALREEFELTQALFIGLQDSQFADLYTIDTEGFNDSQKALISFLTAYSCGASSATLLINEHSDAGSMSESQEKTETDDLKIALAEFTDKLHLGSGSLLELKESLKTCFQSLLKEWYKLSSEEEKINFLYEEIDFFEPDGERKHTPCLVDTLCRLLLADLSNDLWAENLAMFLKGSDPLALRKKIIHQEGSDDIQKK